MAALVLTLLVVLLNGCAFDNSSRTEDGCISADLRMESAKGIIENVPVHMSTRSDTFAFNEYHPVWRIDPSGNHVTGGFADGMSGCPIYDHSGNCVGVLTMGYAIGTHGATGAATPIERVKKALQESRRIGNPFLTQSSCVAGDLRPGMVAKVCSVWGDMEIGMSGVVSIVEGADVVLFGHGFMRESPGPRAMAVFRACPVAVVASHEGGDFVEARSQNMIGSTTCDAWDGICGMLGKQPPQFDLSVTIKSGSRGCNRENSRLYHVAKYLSADNAEERRCIVECIGDSLRRSFLREHYPIELSVDARYDDPAYDEDNVVLREDSVAAMIGNLDNLLNRTRVRYRDLAVHVSEHLPD